MLVLVEELFKQNNSLSSYNKKIRGIPVKIRSVQANGVNINKFDRNQVKDIYSKGIKWLDDGWDTVTNNMLKDIYDIGQDQWGRPFKSLSDIEQLAHPEYVYADILYDQVDDVYELKGIMFTIGWTIEYNSTNRDFFGQHNMSWTWAVTFNTRGEPTLYREWGTGIQEGTSQIVREFGEFGGGGFDYGSFATQQAAFDHTQMQNQAMMMNMQQQSQQDQLNAIRNMNSTLPVLVDQIMTKPIKLNEKKTTYSTTWVADKKFNGGTVELNLVKINGKKVLDFDKSQISKFLSSGLVNLTKYYNSKRNKLLTDIYRVGNDTWENKFKSRHEMEKHMYLDTVQVDIDCSEKKGIYTLKSIDFTIWWNSKYEHMSEKFFGGHSITWRIVFDKTGKVIRNDEWNIEG